MLIKKYSNRQQPVLTYKKAFEHNQMQWNNLGWSCYLGYWSKYCKNKKYCFLAWRLHCIINILHYSTFTLSVHTLISGWTQQFVCPYIVSGLKVAATKNTFFPDNALKMGQRSCELVSQSTWHSEPRGPWPRVQDHKTNDLLKKEQYSLFLTDF